MVWKTLTKGWGFRWDLWSEKGVTKQNHHCYCFILPYLQTHYGQFITWDMGRATRVGFQPTTLSWCKAGVSPAFHSRCVSWEALEKIKLLPSLQFHQKTLNIIRDNFHSAPPLKIMQLRRLYGILTFTDWERRESLRLKTLDWLLVTSWQKEVCCIWLHGMKKWNINKRVQHWWCLWL